MIWGWDPVKQLGNFSPSPVQFANRVSQGKGKEGRKDGRKERTKEERPKSKRKRRERLSSFLSSLLAFFLSFFPFSNTKDKNDETKKHVSLSLFVVSNYFFKFFNFFCVYLCFVKLRWVRITLWRLWTRKAPQKSTHGDSTQSKEKKITKIGKKNRK